MQGYLINILDILSHLILYIFMVLHEFFKKFLSFLIVSFILQLTAILAINVLNFLVQAIPFTLLKLTLIFYYLWAKLAHIFRFFKCSLIFRFYGGLVSKNGLIFFFLNILIVRFNNSFLFSNTLVSSTFLQLMRIRHILFAFI